VTQGTKTADDGRAATWVTAPRVVLFAVAAVAWLLTIRWAQSMGNGPGTMGLGWDGFVGVWAVMMAAMMLPTVSLEIPAAAQLRIVRALGFAIGYMSVWAAVGLAALAAADAAHLAIQDSGVATGAAALAFSVCGLYQFSPAKTRALARCSPKPQRPGAAPEAQALVTVMNGVRQGCWCLASSWALMALIIVFGVMNMLAMVAIFVVTFAERRPFSSAGVRRVTGLASLALAALTLAYPQLAPGLHVSETPMHM
jgi:predicted metal-binding membrane protein